MRVSYDPNFLERVVFDRVHALEGTELAGMARRYHREREAAYGAAEGPARDLDHDELHRRWFLELALDRPLARAAAEAGLDPKNTPGVFVHGVVSPHDEGADLFEKDGARTVVIAVRPSRWLAKDDLPRFLRHELRLVADLLDPAFRYEGGFREGPGSVPLSLAKDRYRLLWKTSADGRLERAGHAGLRAGEEWRGLFARAFSFLPAAAIASAFERVWGGNRPTHVELLAWSEEPRRTLGGLASGAGPEPEGPAPGARCPLCGFPTFSWHGDAGALAPGVAARIQRGHPAWRPELGACSACVERYELAERGAFGRS